MSKDKNSSGGRNTFALTVSIVSMSDGCTILCRVGIAGGISDGIKGYPMCTFVL